MTRRHGPTSTCHIGSCFFPLSLPILFVLLLSSFPHLFISPSTSFPFISLVVSFLFSPSPPLLFCCSLLSSLLLSSLLLPLYPSHPLLSFIPSCLILFFSCLLSPSLLTSSVIKNIFPFTTSTNDNALKPVGYEWEGRNERREVSWAG